MRFRVNQSQIVAICLLLTVSGHTIRGAEFTTEAAIKSLGNGVLNQY
jgi:hypothetical protein